MTRIDQDNNPEEVALRELREMVRNHQLHTGVKLMPADADVVASRAYARLLPETILGLSRSVGEAMELAEATAYSELRWHYASMLASMFASLSQSNIFTTLALDEHLRIADAECRPWPAACMSEITRFTRHDIGPVALRLTEGCLVSGYFRGVRLHRSEDLGPAISFIRQDGLLTCEEYWRNGIMHRSNGPARIRYLVDDNGGVEEAWMLFGRLHRENAPAIITHSGSGHTKSEQWFRSGVLHRADGPAMVGYDATANAVTFAAFYVNGMEHRDNGPAWISLGDEAHAIHLSYRKDGAEHRSGGHPSTITVSREGFLTFLHYFEHGRPRTAQPTIVGTDSAGSRVAEVWYRTSKNGLELHRTDGPAYWQVTADALTIEYNCNGELHREAGPARLRFDLHGRLTEAGWYIRGKLHRQNGPAMHWRDAEGNSIETFYQHGLEHREDGPSSITCESGGGIIATNWAAKLGVHNATHQAAWPEIPAAVGAPDEDRAFARKVLAHWIAEVKHA